MTSHRFGGVFQHQPMPSAATLPLLNQLPAVQLGVWLLEQHAWRSVVAGTMTPLDSYCQHPPVEQCQEFHSQHHHRVSNIDNVGSASDTPRFHSHGQLGVMFPGSDDLTSCANDVCSTRRLSKNMQCTSRPCPAVIITDAGDIKFIVIERHSTQKRSGSPPHPPRPHNRAL